MIKCIKDKNNNIIEFTIDRKLWLRKTYINLDDKEMINGKKSYLLNTYGAMCCLGFYMSACGLSSDFLLKKESPSNLFSPDAYPKQIEWLLDMTKNNCSNQNKLIVSNDLFEYNSGIEFIKCHISNEEQEEMIISIFAKNGIKVRFEG